jgi:hypothetical protein
MNLLLRNYLHYNLYDQVGMGGCAAGRGRPCWGWWREVGYACVWWRLTDWSACAGMRVQGHCGGTAYVCMRACTHRLRLLAAGGGSARRAGRRARTQVHARGRILRTCRILHKQCCSCRRPAPAFGPHVQTTRPAH